MLSVQTHSLTRELFFPIGAHRAIRSAWSWLCSSRRARRVLLVLLWSWCLQGMRRNACALSRPNPLLIHHAVSRGGTPAVYGDRDSAALISKHVAWLSCGMAESRQGAIVL